MRKQNSLFRDSRDNHGFTFVELMFAVLILSFGLTGVLNSFMTTLSSLQRTQNIELVSQLAEEKMEDIKRAAMESNGIAQGRTSGQFELPQGKTLVWELVVIPSGIADQLNEVRLITSWPEHNVTQRFLTTTYLNNLTTKK